jgi:5-methyltetrahydropteroyltriglutamate--homocysteine methyltransferase
LKISSDGVLTTHTGSLPRPDRLAEIHKKRQADQDYDEAALRSEIEAATLEVVSRQAEVGVSVVSDGEMSKGDYIDYGSWRLAGFSGRTPAESAFYFSDMLDTPELIDFTYRDTNFKLPVCVGEISYTGDDLVQADIAGLRAAIEKSPHQPAEAFLPAVAPGLIAMCFTNQHYAAYEDYVFALADAMAVEYCAIVDAGFLLQIDAPDLAFGADFFTWMRPEIDRLGLRGFQELSVAAMNRALEGIPADRVRVHLCWANYMGLHLKDLPLRDVLEPAFTINAMAIGFEAANPAHMHEWTVFEDLKVPDDKVIMPGVIDTKTHVVEHPDLVAERIVRYARLVGTEKIIPGTDCGFGTFVGLGTVHPQSAWRKLESLGRGAAIATRRLAKS